MASPGRGRAGAVRSIASNYPDGTNNWPLPGGKCSAPMIDFRRCGIFATPFIHRFCGQKAAKITTTGAYSDGLEQSWPGIAVPGGRRAAVPRIPYPKPNLQGCGTAIAEDSNRDCV